MDIKDICGDFIDNEILEAYIEDFTSEDNYMKINTKEYSEENYNRISKLYYRVKKYNDSFYECYLALSGKNANSSFRLIEKLFEEVNEI